MPQDKVPDLVVILDSRLNLEAHVANVVRCSFYQLRQLRYIWRSLTTDARQTFATAFVANRVDYCNAMLCVTPAVVIRRLQNGTQPPTLVSLLVLVILGARHIGSSRRPPLAATASEQTVQNYYTTFDCVLGTRPAYFSSIACTVADNSGRPGLRSAERGDLFVP